MKAYLYDAKGNIISTVDFTMPKTPVGNYQFSLKSQETTSFYMYLATATLGFKDTRSGSIKKRITILEQTDYLKRAGVRKTQPGSEGILYEATFKANAAMKLEATNFEELFSTT